MDSLGQLDEALLGLDLLDDGSSAQQNQEIRVVEDRDPAAVPAPTDPQNERLFPHLDAGRVVFEEPHSRALEV